MDGPSTSERMSRLSQAPWETRHSATRRAADESELLSLPEDIISQIACAAAKSYPQALLLLSATCRTLRALLLSEAVLRCGLRLVCRFPDVTSCLRGPDGYGRALATLQLGCRQAPFRRPATPLLSGVLFERSMQLRASVMHAELAGVLSSTVPAGNRAGTIPRRNF